MKSAVITSGEHWLTIDGIDYLRGTIEVIERLTYSQGDQEAIKISGSSVNAAIILVNGTTIDGVEVGSQDQLVDFIKQYSFREGGGDGSGVTTVSWDNVTDKPLHQIATPIEQAEGQVPVYTQNGQLPVGVPEFPENAVPLIVVSQMIEDYNTAMRSNIQEIQEGVDNEKHITPALLKAFVEWFSAELLIIDEEYTDMPTSEQVNEKYPDARVRTILYLPNSGSGMKYTKLNATQWEAMPYTVA